MAISLGLNGFIRFRRQGKRFPEGNRIVNLADLQRLRDSEGKGILGCIVFIVLIGTAIFMAVRLGPLYYSNSGFESDVKAEVSRAGARSLRDREIISGILSIAKRNKISLTQDDIKVDRFAGQVHVEVSYAIPVSFILFERDIKFQIDASSFVGTQ